MEYRTWPALDARVSLLGFGCMRFPTDDAGCVQEDAAAAMLRRALEAGVNYIDTAYFYHEEQSERVLGRVLADVPGSAITWPPSCLPGRWSPWRTHSASSPLSWSG